MVRDSLLFKKRHGYNGLACCLASSLIGDADLTEVRLMDNTHTLLPLPPGLPEGNRRSCVLTIRDRMRDFMRISEIREYRRTPPSNLLGGGLWSFWQVRVCRMHGVSAF